MKLYKIFATCLAVLSMAVAFGQNPPRQGGNPPGQMGGKMRHPSVAEEIARMTEHLNLSKEQQKKIRPILEEAHKQGKAIFENDKLDREQKHERLMKSREAADKKIRALLTDEQRKKWDQRPRPGGHGGGQGGHDGPPPFDL